MINTTEKPPVVIIENLTKQFPGATVPALDKINALIRPGQITGLVGPDGAGKTTLLRLIACLLLPTAGHIKVLGFDTQKEPEKIQEITGYLQQKFGLYEDLTVLENMEFSANLRGLDAHEKEEAFARMLKFAKLAPFINRLAGQLSGGMKQKLGIACALLSRPKLLLLDEPSVGVDPVSRRDLWEMVQELVTKDIAVVWATSYLDEAERCPDVLLLREGKLLFAGPPQELTARVADRIYKVDAPLFERRKKLNEYLHQKDIIDGVIQGRKLRLVFAKGKYPAEESDLIKATPRFEDAFVDLIGLRPKEEVGFFGHVHHKILSDKPPIQAINLTKKFGDFTAVDNINFTVNRGEIFGLLGPNGAGKSTTFKMLCGLLKTTQGQALVSGYDLKIAALTARARMGYMAQNFSLYGDLTVIQNLSFFAGIYGLGGAKQTARMKRMIVALELEPYLHTFANTLPLGFKQRLSLACAVIHEPDVLFLDEPTSGVDPTTRREFWSDINAMAEKGVTIMVTTHFMDEAEYCDRIALIYDGKNIALGTPEEIKSTAQTAANPDPTLEDAFIMQIEAIERQKSERA